MIWSSKLIAACFMAQRKPEVHFRRVAIWIKKKKKKKTPSTPPNSNQALTNHLAEHRLQSCSWAQVPGCREPPASAGEVRCWMPAASPASLYMLYSSHRRVQHAQEIKIFMMALIRCCSFSRRPSAFQTLSLDQDWLMIIELGLLLMNRIYVF